MNKIILGLLLIFTSVVNADDATTTITGEDCRPATEISQKFGNFTDVDLDDETSFRVCGRLLMKEDPVLIANAKHLSTPANIMYFEDEIDYMSVSGNAEKIASHMNENSLLMDVITDLSIPGFLFVAIFITAVLFATSGDNSGYRMNGMISIGKSLIFIFAFGFMQVTSTYLTINYVASYRALIYNQANHKAIDKIREMSVTELIPAVTEQTATLANAMHYYEFINVATMLDNKAKHWGSDIEIDTTMNKWGFDISNPTVGQFKEYEAECEQTDYVLVDRELNLHLKNLNYTYLANQAIFNSGGATANYNCQPNYGKQVEVLRVSNNVPTLIKRFYLDNFAENMADDLTFKDGVSAAFSKLTGDITLEMEAAETIASQNLNSITTQMLIAEGAALEEQDANTTLTTSPSYNALKRMHQNKMGDMHTFKEIEGLDSVGNIAKETIEHMHYSYSELFGIGLEKDPIVNAKKSIGYTFIQNYVRQTALYQAEYDCALRDGENYLHRQEYAKAYNNISNDTKLKSAGSFGGTSKPECYRFNSNGTITAGANPETQVEFLEMIKRRIRAVDIYMQSRTAAALELILENDDLDTQLIVDALNSISPDLYGVAKSYTALTKTRQQLVGATNTIQDAYDFVYSISYDTTKPQSFYNYARMYKDANASKDKLDKDMSKYNLGDYLSTNIIAFNKSKNADLEEKEGSLAKMLRFNCPVIDENGNCVASLIELNSSANEMMLTQALTISGYYYGTALFDQGCETASKGVDQTVGATFGKAKYFTPMGIACVFIDVLDAANGVFVKPVMTTSWVAWAATELASFAPAFVDLVMFFVIPMCLVVAFIIGLFQLYIDITFGTIKYFALTDRRPEDLQEFLSLERSTKTIKSAFMILLISLVVLMVIAELLTSPQIGGALHDAFFNGYESSPSIVNSIVRSLGVIITTAWLTLIIIFKLPIRLINQTLELTDTKGQSLSEEMSNFGMGLLTGFVMTKLAHQTKSAANNLERSIKKPTDKDEDNTDPNKNPENGLDTSGKGSKPSTTNYDTKTGSKKGANEGSKKESSIDDKIKGDLEKKKAPEKKHYKIEGDILGKSQDEIEKMAKDAISKQDKLDDIAKKVIDKTTK
nr:hypothetical protein [Moritella viscosa]SHO14751.1 1,4-alpha-glucan-branching enzyme [Moritella viscosa]